MANQLDEKENNDGNQNGGDGTTRGKLERRQSIRAIIANYEAEEEAFLRELDQMQAECAETEQKMEKTGFEVENDNAGTEEEQPAMLGTLCTLISEITKLRRENGRLKRRISRQPAESTDTSIRVKPSEVPLARPTGGLASGLVQSGCTAALCSLPKRLLPASSNGGGNFCLPLLSSGGSAISCCSSTAVGGLFGRQQSRMPMMATGNGTRGAREQLSSPPPGLAPPQQKIGENSLSVSAYSADLSSDSSQLYRRKTGLKALAGMLKQQQQPKVAEREHFEDEFWDNAHQLPPSSAGGEKSRRGMLRRADERRMCVEEPKQQQFLRLSSSLTTSASGTSPSAGSSASSSVEPPQNGTIDASANNVMSASRSSFLELFGIGSGGRRNQGRQKTATTNPFGAAFVSAVDSLVARRITRRRRKDSVDGIHQQQKRHSALMAPPEEECPSPPYSPAHSPYTDGYSSGGNVDGINSANSARIESEPNLNWRKRRGGKSDISRGRPQSCLEPTECDLARQTGVANTSIHGRTKSCRSVALSRGPSSGRDTPMLAIGSKKMEARSREELAEIRLEMQLLKARNARLIEQLREKSGRLSAADARLDRLAHELEQAHRRERFNECVDGISIRTRLAMGIERAFGALEERMGGQMRKQLQTLRLEAQRQQQMALEAGSRDRQALQDALVQIERLQRDNFVLCQRAENITVNDDKGVQSQLEWLPSFDALYSFAAGLVQKLAQRRQMLGRQCAEQFQADIELLCTQSQLLVAHAQIESLRAQLALFDEKLDGKLHGKRPASFHGECFPERLAKSRLKCFLPFKLHGQRLRQQRQQYSNGKHDISNGTFDALVEANEQSIESEFLRLFDSARCLSRICAPSTGDSPLMCRRLLGTRIGSGSARAAERELPMEERSIGGRRTQSGGSAIAKDCGGNHFGFVPNARNSPPTTTALQRQKQRRNSSAQHAQMGQPHGPQASPSATASPLLKLRRLSAQFLGGTDNWASSALAASTGTPVLVRKTPLLENNGSPRLVEGQRAQPTRPMLVRQFSTDQSCPPPTSRQLPGSPLLQSMGIGGQHHHRRDTTPEGPAGVRRQRPPSLLRPPTPSAPPISLLQCSLCRSQCRNSADRSPSRFGFQPVDGGCVCRAAGTSSTRRPLTRAMAGSEERSTATNVTSRAASQSGQIVEPKHSASGSRSSSMSRLPMPKAVVKLAEPKVQGIAETTQMPKAVKKAGNSWLNKLRRKAAANGTD